MGISADVLRRLLLSSITQTKTLIVVSARLLMRAVPGSASQAADRQQLSKGDARPAGAFFRPGFCWAKYHTDLQLNLHAAADRLVDISASDGPTASPIW